MLNQSDTEMNSHLLPEESVTLVCVAVVLSMVAIISNALLIYVVVRTAALRTSANLFIASLSAGELLTGMFVIPFAGTSTPSGEWDFSPVLCNFVGLMGVLGPCASSLSLLAVSADRCVAVSKPFHYASLITNKSTLVIILVVWTLSLLVSLLPLAKWGRYSYSDSFRVCMMRSTSSVSEDNVPEVLVKEILCIFIPMGLVMITVLKSVYHIRKHRRVFALVPAIVAITSMPAFSSNMNAKNSNVKASRTLLLVFTVFITFCMPSAVASVLCHRPSSCYVTTKWLRALLWLSFLSCIINPVIIMTLNRKFRSRLKSLLDQRKCQLCSHGNNEKEPFTISTGLQTVLEASLFVKPVQDSGHQDAGLTSHVGQFLQPSTYMTEQAQSVFIQRLNLPTL